MSKSESSSRKGSSRVAPKLEMEDVIVNMLGLDTIKCPQCRKRFDCVEDMEDHRKVHMTTYFCDDCHKSFTTQGGYWKHMKTHTDERSFVCTICNKSFTQQANLQRHHLVHTGQKPYQCTICMKSFSQNANAQKHMLLHTGKKPFRCGVCDKAFAQQANLQKHERIHTGDKPYTCHICQKNYSQLANMQKHLIVHSKIGSKHISKYIKVITVPQDANELIVDVKTELPPELLSSDEEYLEEVEEVVHKVKPDRTKRAKIITILDD